MRSRRRRLAANWQAEGNDDGEKQTKQKKKKKDPYQTLAFPTRISNIKHTLKQSVSKSRAPKTRTLNTNWPNSKHPPHPGLNQIVRRSRAKQRSLIKRQRADLEANFSPHWDPLHRSIDLHRRLKLATRTRNLPLLLRYHVAHACW